MSAGWGALPQVTLYRSSPAVRTKVSRSPAKTGLLIEPFLAGEPSFRTAVDEDTAFVNTRTRVDWEGTGRVLS